MVGNISGLLLKLSSYDGVVILHGGQKMNKGADVTAMSLFVLHVCMSVWRCIMDLHYTYVYIQLYCIQ